MCLRWEVGSMGVNLRKSAPDCVTQGEGPCVQRRGHHSITCSIVLSCSYCHCLVSRLCRTLCDPVDCSPPGSSVHGISQGRILECVAISFSGDLPDPGIEPASSVLADGFFTIESLILVNLHNLCWLRKCSVTFLAI